MGTKASPTKSTWSAMIARCTNSKHPSYPLYGGRGIRVCKRWILSFANFQLDMGKRPSLNHSIDRIDNNKGYYKKNCRWATRKEQNSNRRDNVVLTLNGESMIASRWAERVGITLPAMLYRIKNFDDESALFAVGRRPVRGAKHKLSKLTEKDVLKIRERRNNGEKLSILASEYEVSQNLISRIAKRKTWRHI